MIKYVFILCFFFNFSYGQVLVRRDDMENPSTWRGTSTLINSSFIGGNSNIIDSPSNYPLYASSDSCYSIKGIGLGSSIIEADTFIYPNVSLTSGKQHQIRFKVASLGIYPAVNTAAGVDQTDWIELQYSLNNGLSWWRDIQIQGINNASWTFNGAIGTNAKLNISRVGSTSTTAPAVYVSNAGNPIVNVSVNIPFTTAVQVRMRFVTNINAIGETFLLDDVEIWDLTTILPINLQSFSGNKEGNKIRLKWTTLSETNNDYFSIYRSPNGLEYWQLIGNISGAGNSTNLNNYTFIDSYPTEGLNYYVLMQTDYDGRREQFPPIVVPFILPPTNSTWSKYNFLGQKVK